MKYKRIKNLAQYTKYCENYERLILKDPARFKDEIELLELLIEDYDNKVIEQIGSEHDLDPVELLKYLMDEHNLTKSALSRELEVSRQLITEIVNYKRNISKRMVMKLSKRFKMMPIAFSREYELNHEGKSKKKSLELP